MVVDSGVGWRAVTQSTRGASSAAWWAPMVGCRARGLAPGTRVGWGCRARRPPWTEIPAVRVGWPVCRRQAGFVGITPLCRISSSKVDQDRFRAGYGTYFRWFDLRERPKSAGTARGLRFLFRDHGARSSVHIGINRKGLAALAVFRRICRSSAVFSNSVFFGGRNGPRSSRRTALKAVFWGSPSVMGVVEPLISARYVVDHVSTA